MVTRQANVSGSMPEATDRATADSVNGVPSTPAAGMPSRSDGRVGAAFGTATLSVFEGDANVPSSLVSAVTRTPAAPPAGLSRKVCVSSRTSPGTVSLVPSPQSMV